MKAVSLHVTVQVEDSVDTKSFRDHLQKAIGVMAGVVQVNMRPHQPPYPIIRNDATRTILYVDPLPLHNKLIHRPEFGLTPRELACHLGAKDLLATPMALMSLFEYRESTAAPATPYTLGSAR